ncbi:hypothetical protein [Sulfitobacter delicatus]|uniref:Uncharacterized protein n=1 Tax=Sulfitobacter delicatus TaxID=218672 RepID=A0A1G7MLC5_9RHOB|nr:hypothetical protein [Sulfitobacter delicatus]SDF62605.1 hypothetical protein SAMN04489759_102599 [Sulfitobacter delicatus]
MRAMIDANEFTSRAEALRALFKDKLRIKSHDLHQAFGRAGRDLPRGLRADGRLLSRTERVVGNPLIARQLEPTPVWAALDRVNAHLRAVDVGYRRRGRLLDIAATVAFNLIVVIAGFVLWLWWRGYV